jgi:hypothetical protein
MEVTIAIVGSRHEAGMIVGMLAAEDVPARISGDDAGGVDLALQAQGVRVLVDAADEAAARRILEESPDGRSERSTAAERTPNAFQQWVIRLLGGSGR